MGLDKAKLTRRALMAGGAAAVGALAYHKLAPKHDPHSENRSHDTLRPDERGPMRPRFDESFLDIEKKPRMYAMGRLAGVKFGGLLSEYTIGEERRVRAEEGIDFKFQQASLWRRKLEYVKKNNPDVYGRVQEAARYLFSSYDQDRSTKMPLLQYRDHTKTSLDSVRKDLHLDGITKLAAFNKLGHSQVQLLHRLEHEITANGLLAFALTEIMPTEGSDARTGAAVLDFLLQHAGVEYVDRIPAVHDSRISVGIYQFTSDALYELGHERHGASLIQSIMPTRHIPASVLQLHGDQHHKAAYLFAVYNLAMFVRDFGEGRSEKFLEHFSSMPVDVVTEYIAAAHHLPANARRALDAYTDELVKYQKKTPEEKKKSKVPDTFQKHCETKGLGTYCRKTKDNLSALRSWSI